MFGTIRRLSDIDSEEGFKRSGAEREAINAPIQETSAQYCLFSMIVLQDLITNLDVAITLQIHDAVYLKAAETLKEFCAEALEVCFSECPVNLFDITSDRMPVPMTIDVEIGTAWDNTQPFN
jgi:DNA polymerase-1